MRRCMGYYVRKGMAVATVATVLATSVPMGNLVVRAEVWGEIENEEWDKTWDEAWDEKRDEMRGDEIWDDEVDDFEDADDAEIVVRLNDGTNIYAPSDLPSHVEVGSWNQDAYGNWTFVSVGSVGDYDATSGVSGKLAKGWAAAYNPYAGSGQENYDWFRFDENGVMITGWFVDADGSIYYLNPKSDGRRGAMLVGWQWIDLDGDGITEQCYFNEQSDGTMGKLIGARDDLYSPIKIMTQIPDDFDSDLGERYYVMSDDSSDGTVPVEGVQNSPFPNGTDKFGIMGLNHF